LVFILQLLTFDSYFFFSFINARLYLYSFLGHFLRENIGGGEAYILRGGPKSETSRYLGLQALKNTPLKIGGVNTVLSFYKVLPKREIKAGGEEEHTMDSIYKRENDPNKENLSQSIE